jgi:hypothetical protein
MTRTVSGESLGRQRGYREAPAGARPGARSPSFDAEARFGALASGLGGGQLQQRRRKQQQMAVDDRLRYVDHLLAVVLRVLAEHVEGMVGVDRVPGHQNPLGLELVQRVARVGGVCRSEPRPPCRSRRRKPDPTARLAGLCDERHRCVRSGG